MKYKETGFRAFYKTLTAVMLTDDLRLSLEGFPGAGQANCILTYGYMDQEAGMTLEVLAAGIKSEEGFRFFDGTDEICSKIRAQQMEEIECFWFEDKDGDLAERYRSKIEMLRPYDVSEEIEKTRGMGVLDKSRDPYFIDDVLVYLTKEGLEPEGCWTRIFGLGEHWFMGTLLNEPAQNFGYHMGETIGFFVQRTEDERYLCYTDMTSSMKLTAEDLEDGTMLKEAVTAFNRDRKEPLFIDVLEFLRDSYVWIPCNAVLSEEDQANIEKMVEEAGDDPESLIGTVLTNQDTIRMVPDILQNGDAFFFPVFSSPEEMGEYGNGFSKIEKHFLEAISLARNNKRNVTGIVLNAFTEPFVLDRELFDMVENMKTRLEEK